MEPLAMTLSDLDFKVTTFFWSRISQRLHFLWTNLLQHTNRKPYL